MFRQLGADVVGMTNLPEASLAREAGICYATVAVVTNWAAGVSDERLADASIGGFMAEQMPRVRALFTKVIETHRDVDCQCSPCALQ